MKKICLLLALVFVVSSVLSCADQSRLPDGTSEESAASSVSGDATTAADTEIISDTSAGTSSGTTKQDDPAPLPDEYGLPDDSSVVDIKFAKKISAVAACQSKTSTAKELDGFEILLQKNYDKPADDRSHTCAYTLGAKEISYKGEKRNLVVIAIRGTNAGEWYSNFDFAPSHDNDTVWAENFHACAIDILNNTIEIIESIDNPLIVVCGHSRGAAAANLLGVLLNGRLPVENTFVYTFATPTTVRCLPDGNFDGNIFNFINPDDVVPLLPPPDLGYVRAGTDIVLSGDEAHIEKINSAISMFAATAKDIESYYGIKYSLTGSGRDEENGMTCFELMNAFADVLIRGLSGGDTSLGVEISEQSELYGIANTIESLSKAELANIMLQHMPTTYQLLITRYKG